MCLAWVIKLSSCSSQVATASTQVGVWAGCWLGGSNKPESGSQALHVRKGVL